ncbi:MAG: ribosome recycling factor [Muribaculaceae bacterium]|nr:ribosome recycling factor [Muribaculaceae bacterium]
MRKNISLLLEEAKSQFSGYTALYAYRLMNLCVKADPVSLLSIEINENGRIINIETVANVSRPDDYHFEIYPKTEGALKEISKGIVGSHPEFKQEIKNQNEEDDEENQFLYITIPDTDDDRYKALKDGVEILSDECKANLDFTFSKYSAKIIEKLEGGKKEEIDEANEQLKELKEQIEKISKDYKEAKLKEIEESHDAFLEKKEAEKDREEREEKAHNKNAGMSMKLFGEDDDE